MEREDVNKSIKIIDRILYEMYIQKDVKPVLGSTNIIRLENKFYNDLRKLFNKWRRIVIARSSGVERIVEKRAVKKGLEDITTLTTFIDNKELEELIFNYMYRGGQMAGRISAPTLQWIRDYSLNLSNVKYTELTGKIQSEVLYSVRAGEGSRELAARLDDVFDKLSTTDAERIARTEIARAHNETVLDQVDPDDLIDVIQFDPCELCTDLASEYPKKAKDARGDFPAHPNCRCETTEYVE
jgi:hypothetical protein